MVNFVSSDFGGSVIAITVCLLFCAAIWMFANLAYNSDNG